MRPRCGQLEHWISNALTRLKLRVAQTEKKNNISIDTAIEELEELHKLCGRQIHHFFGHVVKRAGDNIEEKKTLLAGKAPVGAKERDRVPIRCTDGVRSQFGTVPTAVSVAQWKALTDHNGQI